MVFPRAVFRATIGKERETPIRRERDELAEQRDLAEKLSWLLEPAEIQRIAGVGGGADREAPVDQDEHRMPVLPLDHHVAAGGHGP